MTPTILSPSRLRELQALQGSSGAIPALVAKAALLTNGVYYVDVLAENPSLASRTNKDGELVYADDDGAFSLAKLHNAVKSTVTRKGDKAKLDGHSFPNLEAIRDDDAGTVYVVNWDKAPTDETDETDA